jgi:hypothetical protein
MYVIVYVADDHVLSKEQNLAVVGHKFGNSHKEPYVDDTHMINFS